MSRKVLIVDDEVLVRIGIKHSVNWEENNLSVIGEASDGRQCLEMVERWNPDLLILDINMPEINGIQVLKILNEKKYDGKVIILTCYEEIEYARQAIKYGAADYVLKTSITENGLLHAIQDLTFEKRIHREQSDEISAHDIEKELLHIIEGYSENYDVLPLTPNYLYCLICKITNMDQIMERYAKKGTGLFYHSLNSILEQVLGRVKEYVSTNYRADEIVIFISFSENPGEQECILQIRQIVQQLHNILSEYLQVNSDIGISSVKHKMEKMQEAYAEAIQALSQKFIYPNKNIFYYEIPHNKEKDKEEQSEYEMRIREYLSDHKYEKLKEELSDYLEWIRKNGIDEVSILIKFMCEIVQIIQSNEKMWDTDYESDIRQKNSLEEMEIIIFSMINKLSDSQNSTDNNYLIRKADEYIKNNYNKNISLNSLSLYLGLSESYTSRLFNKHKGINLPTYINEYRIEKSKILLKSTNMKIYEIADEVGFTTTTAFHIAFKKFEDKSPIEYRNSSI